MEDQRSTLTREDWVPMHHHVIVEALEVKDKTESGLLIPETARHEFEQHEGIVVAVGPGRVDRDGVFRKPQARVGDHVVYSEFAGLDITLSGKTYKNMRDDEIIAIYLTEEEKAERDKGK